MYTYQGKLYGDSDAIVKSNQIHYAYFEHMTLKVGNLVKGQYSFNSMPFICIMMAISSMDSISFNDLQFFVTVATIHAVRY